jgi:hypothetical protein
MGVIEEEGLHLAPQLRQAGVRSVFLGTDGLKASRYLETSGAGVAGPYYSNASTDIKLQTAALGFAKAYSRCYNTPHSVYSAEAYDAAGRFLGSDATDYQGCFDIPGLPHVPRQAVEHHERLGAGAVPGQERAENSLGDCELLVFQQGAGLEDFAEEVDVFPADEAVGPVELDEPAQVGPEIEMETLRLPQSPGSNQITQRRLPRAGRPDENHCRVAAL